MNVNVNRGMWIVVVLTRPEVQVQKLNQDCLALRPSQAETEKMQADIKRICKEAMVLPGQRLSAAGSFDLDTEITKAFSGNSSSGTG